jgi:AcrR family transcriptional regulator
VTTRLSRAEQVERNRAAVLDAARRVFLARGYAGASVDAIADEAGFSKGVVYSQFGGKPDLFLALLDERITERAAENARIAAEHAGLDGLQALLHTNARRTEEGGGWPLLLTEFRVAAARDPELNRRYSALHARTIEHFTEVVAAVLARGGLAPVHGARAFAELIFAIDVGRVLERAAGADAPPLQLLVDLITRMVEPI